MTSIDHASFYMYFIINLPVSTCHLFLTSVGKDETLIEPLSGNSCTLMCAKPIISEVP